MGTLGKVFLFCGASQGRADDCVEWGNNALLAGKDSKSLRILAGLSLPYNSFEVREYTMRALSELGIQLPDEDGCLLAFARELIEALATDPPRQSECLDLLRQLCIENDYMNSVYDFYLLSFAREDLSAIGDQHYWDGATLENIDRVVVDVANKWLKSNTELA